MTDDLTDPGKTALYKDDVVEVKAGYARNFLIPQKKAVYATLANFRKHNLTDPLLAKASDATAKIEEEDDQDLKAYNVLQHYLRNKTVRMLCPGGMLYLSSFLTDRHV